MAYPLSGDDATKGVIKEASKALGSLGPSGLASAGAIGLMLPVAEMIGKLISEKRDKILLTLSGSLILDKGRRKADQFSQVIKAPDGNMEPEADVFLFDGVTEEDTAAETAAAETRLEADGLLFTEPGE